ncbi:hypothetical protein B0H13DRAFT_2322833 [Mycena leptocephala]|nr:hypothetical protein B0H13DRAFT_2322833 [Mycena leptocephala]
MEIYLLNVSSQSYLWLSRSQNHLLSIRLHWDRKGNGVSSKDGRWWERISDIEGARRPAYCQCWKNVKLNIPLILLRRLCQVTLNGFPHLAHPLGELDVSEGPIPFFRGCPAGHSNEASTSFTDALFSGLECLTLINRTPSLVDFVFYMILHEQARFSLETLVVCHNDTPVPQHLTSSPPLQMRFTAIRLPRHRVTADPAPSHDAVTRRHIEAAHALVVWTSVP